MSYSCLDLIYWFILFWEKGCVIFMMKDSLIEIVVLGDYEVEMIFFEILCKISFCFFVMDFKIRCYGWLNLVRERNFV